MNVMVKRGSLDNIITYEHYCDTKADLANIPKEQISLGSVAVVLKDEDDNIGIYIANSNKEWNSFSTGGGGSSMEDISLANLVDISLTNPVDGQILIYNGETGKWENNNNSFNSNDDGIVVFTSSNREVSDITMDRSLEQLISDVKAKKITGAVLTYPVGWATGNDYHFLSLVEYSDVDSTISFRSYNCYVNSPENRLNITQRTIDVLGYDNGRISFNENTWHVTLEE